MKRLRWFAFAVWVACLSLRLSLPAWDICLHRDGQVCGELVPRSCCDSGAPSGKTADEDCSDCTDIHLQPGTGAVRAPALSVMAESGPALVLAVQRNIATDVTSRGRPPWSPGVAPPDDPGSDRSLPLRC